MRIVPVPLSQERFPLMHIVNSEPRIPEFCKQGDCFLILVRIPVLMLRQLLSRRWSSQTIFPRRLCSSIAVQYFSDSPEPVCEAVNLVPPAGQFLFRLFRFEEKSPIDRNLFALRHGPLYTGNDLLTQ
jgi:hypothetical protein